MGFFAITSVSPLIIKIINYTNFNIIDTYFNLSWHNSFGTITIKSNPILINGFYWFIASNHNKLIFILFDFINKSFINSFAINIDFDIHFGLIFNKFNDTFYIPIFKNNKIQFFNINKNSLFS
jgi:hypothetical protein